jgi:2',3'-cyclic-nucleotide 2'-phosphodiesterase (5'-nucleotidase family)
MKNIFFFFLLISASSCTKHFVATKYKFEEQRLNPNSASDEKIASIIRPYKDSLDKEMNVVLAFSDTILTKSIPESDLGNLMCNLVLKKSKDYCNCKVDFTFLNNGGIRLPNLPKGNITLGKIIELMPFENLIDIMTVNGKTLDTLFNYMASKGGWQVSGARYGINKFPGYVGDPKATAVFINGEPLDLNKNYTIAVSDYLAQGGDNCTMLSYLPKTILSKNLRDAIIDGLKEMNTRGEHIKSIIDGRVQIVK